MTWHPPAPFIVVHSSPIYLRLGRAPFVGRARVLELLVDALEQARGSHASVVLLSGDPGIGKTRLLDEFPPPALAAGVSLLRGGSSEAVGMPPYLPFLEALGEYASTTPEDVLRAALGQNAAIVARLVHEISSRLTDLSAPPVLPPQQERLRLFDAVASFIGAIAARSGGALVLGLDDLHWADDATCDLLVHIARRLPRAPQLILAAQREAEAEENPSLVRAVAELNRMRVLRPVHLGPLEPRETALLAAGLVQDDVSPRLSDLLHQHAEGNPFFVEELLGALADAGTLVRGDATWDLAHAPGRLLPTGVLDAIRFRVARLPAAVVELLRVGAIVGRTWSVSVLAAVAGQDVEATEELLVPAVRARLVQPQADGTYLFAHDKIREALYTEVPAGRRQRLHQVVGEVVEREQAQPDARRLADLAFHFVRAGDGDRGVTYALQAAEQALGTAAHAEAVEHFRSAADLLTSQSVHDPRQGRVLLGLGEAAMLIGDHRLAEDSFRGATRLSIQAGQRLQAGRGWYGLGMVRWRQEAVGDAREAFESALTVLGSDDSTEAAETLLRLAELHAVSLGLPAEGLAFGERALAMVERLNERSLEASVCFTLGSIHTWRCELDQGRTLLERALDHSQRSGRPVRIAEVCGILACAHAFAGDLESSVRVTLARREAALRTHDLYQLRHVFGWLAQMSMFRGRWSQANQQLDEALQVMDQLESPEPRAIAHPTRGGVRYY